MKKEYIEQWGLILLDKIFEIVDGAPFIVSAEKSHVINGLKCLQ